jgi:hypothetical protein
MGDAQAMLAHMLDMGRPWIDEGHVLAGLNHVRAGITADRAGADDDNFSAHPVLPFWRGRKLAGVLPFCHRHDAARDIAAEVAGSCYPRTE